MKDWIKNLADDDIKRLFRDEAALAEVPPELKARVLRRVRETKPSAARRRAWLKPVLFAASAAAVLAAAFVIARPYLIPDGAPAAADDLVVPDRDLARGYAGLRWSEAFILFFSGDVSIGRASAWTRAELGAYLGRGDRIRVGAGSSCELQLGDRAVARLGERTEILIEELSARTGRTDIRLTLEAGIILNKVSRMAEEETYRVRTKTLACGVRGTVYSVRVTGADETVVAVKEGKVYALPAGADFERLGRRPAGSDRRVAAGIRRLKSESPSVAAGRELSVSRASADAAAKEADGLRVEIERLFSLETITDKDGASFNAALSSSFPGIRSNIPVPRPISAERKEELDGFDKTAARPVLYQDLAQLADLGAPPPGPALVKIEIVTDPADADLFLAGSSVGRGRFNGIFAEGARLEFLAVRDGYQDATAEVLVSAAGPKPFVLSLKPIRDKTAAATASPSPGKTTPPPTPSPATATVRRTLPPPFAFLTEYAGHEYHLYRASVGWYQALQLCLKNGGHLVTITSAGENKAIIDALHAQNVREDVWIGYTIARKRSYTWITGETSSFTYWDTGRPDNLNGNQEYVYMQNVPGEARWEDAPDDQSHWCILEFDEPAL